MKRGGYIAGSGVDLAEDVHPNFAKLGNNVRIRGGTILFGSEKHRLLIGNDVYINARCVIHGGSARIKIGNNVTLAVGVVIHSDSGPNTSKLLQERYPIKAGPVTIGDDVWICDYVVIMPGVKIGKGSVIGSHSLVKENIPPGCVVGGVPAHILKTFGKR